MRHLRQVPPLVDALEAREVRTWHERVRRPEDRAEKARYAPIDVQHEV